MDENDHITDRRTDAPLRVAAYCRVSTDKEDQLNSLAAQQRFFQSYIAARPGWSPAGIFADKGLSGTSAKRRPEFAAMIRQALDGRIDLIVTKEVSRFARNTVDALQVTRQLKERGVGVLFLSDGIDTRDSDGEFRLTIMASVAQEESRKISERTRWGQTQALRRGVVFGNSSIYGYRVAGGQLFVQPEQAEVVRQIYRAFAAERKSAYAIAKELTGAGVPPPLSPGGPWSAAAVLKILRNEKYTGDLLQRKYRTTDHLTHRKVRNDGAEEQYLLRDHHEAVIHRETFQAAQAELARREALVKKGERHSHQHWYSGKVRCGLCGRAFALKRRRRQGGEYRCFECRGRLNGQGCTAGSVNYQLILTCVRAALDLLSLDFASIAERVLAELRTDEARPEQAALARALERQRARRARALEAFLDGDLSRADMRRITGACDSEISRLEAEARKSGLPRPEDTEGPEIRVLLEYLLETGETVLDEAVRSIEVFPDRFVVALADFPVKFLVRAHGEGTGIDYRVCVDECAPASPDVQER